MYRQVFDPIGGSLGLTSIFAALPLLTLFVLLGIVELEAHWAALISLAVAVVVALIAYHMPAGQAVDGALEGAAFGLFPIMWIVVNAIWIYQMTVRTGHFEVLHRSFGSISDDQRIQAIIIAFCFGALMEALAGFGTPVAISSVMLIALGLPPIRAATVALVANTAPVAFGAIAVPITTLAKLTALPPHDLGSMVGRQTPILALFVPLVLVFIVDGRRGLRQAWPAAVVCGVTFALAQFLCSNYLSLELTDIVASLAAAGAVVLMLRIWQPAERVTGAAPGDVELPPMVAGGSVDDVAFERRHRRRDPAGDVVRAYAPYLLIIAVFALAQLAPVKRLLNKGVVSFSWPGLHVVNPAGKPLSLETFKFDWLPAAGTLLLLAGLLTIAVLQLSPGEALRAYGRTLNMLKWAIVTVMAVLALAYVMNLSGQTITLGRFIAGTGRAFAFLSPLLGWLGVAVTGSDTSSNSLFGALQVTAARQAGLSPTLLAAANSSGGVLGKMVSPQTLAIAAGAVGLAGREGELFRRVIAWSLVFLLGMAVLVFLQSTSVLSWMVP
jgi:lactate permease